MGAAGAVLALLTASVMVTNWRDLTELQDWEASFRSDDVVLPTRTATVDPNQKRSEQHNLTHENVTVVRAELTWTDPAFPAMAPEVRFTVRGPDGKVRAAGSHRGGAVGLDFEIEVVPPQEIPQGTHRFSARDDPHAVFDQRWPAQPDGHGIWTFEIQNTATGTGAGPIFYRLRVEYDYYEGFLREVERGTTR